MSARYHRPRQRAAVGRAIAQWLGLAFVWACAARFGSAGAGSAAETVTIGVATALAFWLPSTAVEVWNEYRHEPRFDGRPVRADRFAVSSVGLLLVQAIGFTLLGFVLRSIDGPASQVVVVATLLAAVLPLVSLTVGPRIALAVHRARPLDPAGEPPLRDLAETSGVADVRFVEVESDGIEGPNAFATGLGRGVTVGLSRSLMTTSEGLRLHVVAHELAHLRRRHVLWSAIAASLGSALVMALSVELVWSVVGAAPTPERLPALVLIVSLVSWPIRLVLAWMSRAHERRADLDAVKLTGVDPRPIRDFHVSERAFLEPTVLARLHAAHPSPAERLELLKRARNLGFDGRG